MKLARRQVLIVAALALVAVAAVVLWARFLRAVPTPLHEAKPGSVAVRVVGTGTVQARVPVTLAPRITATVTQLNADVGDSVKRGQVSVLLDDRDLAARRGVVGSQQEALERNVKAAQAALARAQAELELAASKQRRDAELLRKIARERRFAVITVTHDHRMIEGFDTVFHLDDDVLTRQTQASSPA